MPRLRVTFPVRTALLLAPLLLPACGESDSLSGPTTTPTGTTSDGGGGASTTSGGGGAGATSTGGATTGGTGGATGGTSAGGTTGTGGTVNPLCGNGALDPGEDCDGADLAGATCASIGFPGGDLACGVACFYDTAGCIGSEVCFDGVDNNGNGKLDCQEVACADACGDACLAPLLVGDGESQSGYTAGHANALHASCTAESGPELVFVVTAAQTGVLDVTLVEDGGAPFSVSVRSSCGADASEIACSAAYLPGTGDQKKVTVPVVAGQSLFIVVDGDGASAAGSFTIFPQSRPLFCGDGVEDAPETCDDGNDAVGDGCSPTCQLEPTEVEPNGSIAASNPIGSPWYAQVSPAGDVDVVQISLQTAAGLAVWTDGLGDGKCLDGSMDTVVTLLDGAGNTLATNDDHAGACSLASVASLAPGAYFARIEAPAGASQAAATFPYQLHASTFHCGDAALAIGEECDDGNVTGGDGCSATCKVEVNETEPNGTIVLADAYSSPWIARIDPDGDVDVVAVTVPSAGAKITATTSDPKGGAGCSNVIDTYVEILDAGGAVLALNDDANGGYCSSVTAQNLAAGTYHVRVQAPPLIGAANVFIYSYKLAVQVQ